MFRLISKKLVTAIIIVPFLALFVTNIKSLADFDDIRFAIIAEITKIQGERELWVKISGVRSPAKEGSKLHKYRDTLTINNTPETFAILNFLSQDNKDLGLYVKADSRSVGAIYHFPCAFKGGQFLFGWKLADKTNKACYKGIKVIKSKAQLSSQKQIYSQSSPRKINYCVSETDSGKSFLAVTSGDPFDVLLSLK